jgi:hypothetical protein
MPVRTCEGVDTGSDILCMTLEADMTEVNTVILRHYTPRHTVCEVGENNVKACEECMLWDVADDFMEPDEWVEDGPWIDFLPDPWAPTI